MKMKQMRYFLTVCIIGLGLLSLASCEFEEASHGNLYGYWHLTTVESIAFVDATGTVSVLDVADRDSLLIFWSVQAKLMEMTDRNNRLATVMGRFQRQDDSLFVEKLYYNYRESGDPEVVDVADVTLFGIDTLTPRLYIEYLSTGQLVLRTKSKRLRFKKM